MIRKFSKTYLNLATTLIRVIWRRLTNMRTAIILLCLVALAALPGVFFPQKTQSPQAVSEYINNKGKIGELLDRFQFFEVFTSIWFTSIYLLMFLSLIGCIFSRLKFLITKLYAPPSAVPLHLTKFKHCYQSQVNTSPAQLSQQLRKKLPYWRKKIIQSTETPGVIEISAETGYTHEVGNLVFHISMVLILASLLISHFYSFTATISIVADGKQGFCNSSVALYDTFQGGNKIDGTNLKPFCINVKNFTATYHDNGQPDTYISDIEYQSAKAVLLNSKNWQSSKLTVNHPLRIDGTRVYLMGYGYAPRFTVTYPNGLHRTQTIKFKPLDFTSLLSRGVARFDPPAHTYPNETERRKHQLAIDAIFAPTGKFQAGKLNSIFPTLSNPTILTDIYIGDAGLDTGVVQNAFELDPALISQGRLVRLKTAALTISNSNNSLTLSDGTNIKFTGVIPWVSLQVTRDPAQNYLLFFTCLLIVGMLFSFSVKPKRLWIRIYTTQNFPPRSKIIIAGLVKDDHNNWDKQFHNLTQKILAEINEIE